MIEQIKEKMNHIVKGENKYIEIDEPIIMVLSDFETDIIFENIEIDKFYRCDNKLVIENPTSSLIAYFEKWISLIHDPNTGECIYPSILNIKREIVFEYMIITNKSTDEKFICLPSKISYGETTKIEILIVY